MAMATRAASMDSRAGVTVMKVRCEECGREQDLEAHAAGWVAYRVDLPDDPPPEVTVYCPECAGRSSDRVNALPVGFVHRGPCHARRCVLLLPRVR